MTKIKYKKFKKYFLNDNEGLFVVDFNHFNSIKSWSEAIDIATCCYLEVQRVLSSDALSGNESFIGNMKVTTGLERSLIELDYRYPGLMNLIHTTGLKVNGSKLIRC